MLKYVMEMPGVQCVVITGMPVMQELFVDN